MGESPEKKSGCGILNAVFGRSGFWPRRTTSTGSLPVSGAQFVKTPSGNSRRRRGSSDEASFLDTSSANGSESTTKPVTKPSQYSNRAPPIQPNQNQGKNSRPSQEAGAMVSGSGQGQQRATNQSQQRAANQGQQGATKMSPSQGYVNQGKKVPRDAVGLSGELDSMISDHQKSKGSSTLVRASSSNVMLMGNLGNLRTGGRGGGNVNSNNVLDYLPKTAREETPMMMNGNVGKSSTPKEEKKPSTQPGGFG